MPDNSPNSCPHCSVSVRLVDRSACRPLPSPAPRRRFLHAALACAGIVAILGLLWQLF
jgi:hypothetical protein